MQRPFSVVRQSAKLSILAEIVYTLPPTPVAIVSHFMLEWPGNVAGGMSRECGWWNGLGAWLVHGMGWEHGQWNALGHMAGGMAWKCGWWNGQGRWLVLCVRDWKENFILSCMSVPGGVATRLTSVCVPFHRSLGVVLYELCTLEHAFQGQVCVCVCVRARACICVCYRQVVDVTAMCTYLVPCVYCSE